MKNKGTTQVIDLQGFSADEIVEQAVSDILSISILRNDLRPSNRLPVEIKSQTKNGQPTQLIAKVDKIDKERGLIYSTPMIANIVDTDGDFYSNKNVEEIAHKTLRTKTMTYITDVDHDYKMREDISVVESYVDRSDKNHYAWKVCQDVSKDAEIMADLSNITGVSIWAFMSPVSEGKGKKGKFKLASIRKGRTADNYEQKSVISDIENCVYAFLNEVIGWKDDEGRVLKVDTQDELKEEIDDLNKILNEIEITNKTKGQKVKKKDLIEMLKDDEVREELKSVIDEIENSDDPNDGDADQDGDGGSDGNADNDTDDGKNDDNDDDGKDDGDDDKGEKDKADKSIKAEIKELKDTIKSQGDQIKKLKRNPKMSSKAGSGAEKDFHYYMKNEKEWNELSKSEQREIRHNHKKARSEK